MIRDAGGKEAWCEIYSIEIRAKYMHTQISPPQPHTEQSSCSCCANEEDSLNLQGLEVHFLERDNEILWMEPFHTLR